MLVNIERSETYSKSSTVFKIALKRLLMFNGTSFYCLQEQAHIREHLSEPTGDVS
jgi:hypothetical protein